MKKSELFSELIDGLQIRLDIEKYPNSIFLFKEDLVWVEYNFKKKYLWICSSIFERLGGNKEEVKRFISDFFELNYRIIDIDIWKYSLNLTVTTEYDFLNKKHSNINKNLSEQDILYQANKLVFDFGKKQAVEICDKNIKYAVDSIKECKFYSSEYGERCSEDIYRYHKILIEIAKMN